MATAPIYAHLAAKLLKLRDVCPRSVQIIMNVVWIMCSAVGSLSGKFEHPGGLLRI